MARAACIVSGRQLPLPSDMDVGDKVFLFACPAGVDSQFSSDDLSDRLARSGTAYGVDWDRDSPTFGLRFASRSSGLVASIKPFSSSEARTKWESWHAEQLEMQQVTRSAATSAASGKELVFLSEDEVWVSMKVRKKPDSLGERD